MNVRDLKYLVALADIRHFGRAAEACFVSQPTLSTQIRKLEDELGVQLIERAPRKVMLTEVGEEIVARSRLVLRDIEQIYETARRAEDPEAGTLRLGVFPTLGPYLLPHVIPALQQRFPELEMLLVEEKSNDLLEQLQAGRLDAALLALPIDHEAFELEPLFEEPFFLATRPDHPLHNTDSVGVTDLQGHTVLLLEEGHCLRDQALDVCHLAGAHEKAGFRATSLETLRQMVAANVGITLLPALSIRPPVAENPNVTITPFAPDAPTRTIAMVWRKSSAVREFLKKVAGIIRDQATQALATTD